MSLDDPTRSNTVFQQRPVFEERAVQAREDHRKAAMIDREIAPRQHVAVDGLLADEPVGVSRRRDAGTRGAPVKGRKHLDEAVNFTLRDISLGDDAVEHEVSREATHHDEPIDDRTRTAKTKTVVGHPAKGRDAEVGFWREPAIEADLLATVRLAGSEGREIQEGVADRLLELVASLSSEEDPRHVRFDHGNAGRAVRIRSRAAEIAYLDVDRDPGFRNASARRWGQRRILHAEFRELFVPELHMTSVTIGTPRLVGTLILPAAPAGLIIFARGSGSSRLSPRNTYLAERLNVEGFATLLFDLLTEAESRDRRNVFDIPLLGERLTESLAWARAEPALGGVPLGLFGASTGAAAALVAAARCPQDVARPLLAAAAARTSPERRCLP